MNSSKKSPTIFLDRDGVLITRHLPVTKAPQIRLTPSVGKFIAYCNRNNIHVVVITNQAVIARGLVSEDSVRSFHQLINNRLHTYGAYVDKFYFCPHHPKEGIAPYRKVCRCRKPGIGMYQQAAKDLSIDFQRSFTIGDMTRDIIAAQGAGTKTILMLRGHAGEDKEYNIQPDYVCKNFEEILKIIKKFNKRK